MPVAITERHRRVSFTPEEQQILWTSLQNKVLSFLKLYNTGKKTNHLPILCVKQNQKHAKKKY